MNAITILSISTHTLTWSVTLSLYFFYIATIISTHTLTWSVTPEGLQVMYLAYHFNSHAHVERDSYLRLAPMQWANFNSHAHVERDGVHFVVQNLLIKFQLTRSRGAWLGLKIDIQLPKKISTHTLTWSVTGLDFDVNSIREFQLTRSRGAWLGRIAARSV